MAKRSAWAVKSRRQRREAITSFSKVPLPSSANRVVDLVVNPERFSRREKFDFLNANLLLVAKGLHDAGAKQGKQLSASEAQAKDYLGFLSRKSDAEVDESVAYFATMKLPPIVAKYFMSQTPELRRYLEKRGLPRDSTTLNNVRMKLAKEYAGSFLHTGGRINLPIFEREYVMELKLQRRVQQFLSRAANLAIKRAFPEIRITQNQFRQARKWVKANARRLMLEFEAQQGKKLTDSPKLTLKWDKFFKNETIHGLRKEFEKQFLEKATVKRKVTIQTGQAPVKLGNRLERMASYSQIAEEETKEKVQITQKSREVKAFDLVEEALNNIRNENQATARRLQNLVSKRELSPTNLIKLHDRGSLAQKTFLSVIDDTNFLAEIGSSEVNALARMISFIGPMGKQIPKVKRAAQSPNAEKIYFFLERKGLIERHSGGNVVYLTRRQ